MSWVLVKTTEGRELVVNLGHVINMEPIKVGQNEKLGARLRTIQNFDDGGVYTIEVETSWDWLLSRIAVVRP
jgi:hypothetical protein